MIFLAGVAGVILEEKLGCLENEIEPRVADFIKAVGNMFLTGHQLMVFADVHKKFNTKPWRTHVEAWDTIYSFGEYFPTCFFVLCKPLITLYKKTYNHECYWRNSFFHYSYRVVWEENRRNPKWTCGKGCRSWIFETYDCTYQIRHG